MSFVELHCIRNDLMWLNSIFFAVGPMQRFERRVLLWMINDVFEFDVTRMIKCISEQQEIPK